MSKNLLYTGIAVLALVSCGGGNTNADNADPALAAQEIKVAQHDADLSNPPFRVEDGIIISDNLPVVVDFYADWCGPCKQYEPIFNAVAEKYAGLAVFTRINVDNYPEIAQRYQVSSIPTTVFIQTGGGVLGKQTGLISQTTLESYVNQLVAIAAGNNTEL